MLESTTEHKVLIDFSGEPRATYDWVVVNAVEAFVLCTACYLSAHALFIGPWVLWTQPVLSLPTIATLSIYMWIAFVALGGFFENVFSRLTAMQERAVLKEFSQLPIDAPADLIASARRLEAQQEERERVERRKLRNRHKQEHRGILDRWERFCTLTFWRSFQRLHRLAVIQELPPDCDGSLPGLRASFGLNPNTDGRHSPADSRLSSEERADQRYRGMSNMIVGLHPHGGVPMACCLMSPDAYMLFPTAREFVAGVATIVFLVPVLGLIMRWVGCIGAQRTMLLDKLTTNKGVVLALHPGGAAEAYGIGGSNVREESRVKTRGRAGFYSLACEDPCSVSCVLPCYCFGNDSMASRFLVPPQWAQPWLRRLKIILVWPLGKWWTPVPLENRITVVFGRPVFIRDAKTKQKKSVRQLEDEYSAEIHRIFEKWKHEHYGFTTNALTESEPLPQLTFID